MTGTTEILDVQVTAERTTTSMLTTDDSDIEHFGVVPLQSVKRKIHFDSLETSLLNDSDDEYLTSMRSKLLDGMWQRLGRSKSPPSLSTSIVDDDEDEEDDDVLIIVNEETIQDIDDLANEFDLPNEIHVKRLRRKRAQSSNFDAISSSDECSHLHNIIETLQTSDKCNRKNDRKRIKHGSIDFRYGN